MKYLKVEFNGSEFVRDILIPLKNRVAWAVKQLFPLTYRFHYESGEKKMFSVFKMWFGHTYKVDNFVIDPESMTQDQKIKTFMGDTPVIPSGTKKLRRRKK